MDEVGVCDSSKSANSHDDIHSNQENGSSKKIESRHSNLEASLSEENPTSTQENEHQRKAVPAIQRLPLPPASPPSSRSTRHKRVIYHEGSSEDEDADVSQGSLFTVFASTWYSFHCFAINHINTSICYRFAPLFQIILRYVNNYF